jgi:exonuclease SbcC
MGKRLSKTIAMKINALSPKWQHDDPKVRLQSVLTGKLSADVIKELAINDPDENVRMATIERLEDSDALLGLASNTNSIGTKAAFHWATLVGSDLIRLDVITAELPVHLLIALARYAPAEDFRIRAADYVKDDLDLGVILLADNLSRVHQHCAGRLEDEAVLQKVQRHFKDRDKNVSRIVKSKLQVLAHSRAELEASELLMQTVQDKLSALLAAEAGPDYARRIDVLQHQWQKLANQEPAEGFKLTISALIKSCEEKAAAIPDPVAVLKEEIDKLSGRCENLRQECLNNPAIRHLQDSLATIISGWPKSEPELLQQHTEDLTQLINAQRHWQQLLQNRGKMDLTQFKTRLSELRWPEAFQKPEDFDSVTTLIETELTAQADLAAEKLAQQNDLQELLDKLEAEISEGHIKAAGRARGRLTKFLESFQPAGEQSTRVQQLLAKLQELKDWQGFATQPKRDELCSKMKTLAEDTAIAPPEKAKAIKELQDEWKKLGSSDTRPAQRAWSRFKKLGDQAFGPCAEFFAEQEKTRQLNLQEREKICDSLELIGADHDWSTTDWKSMVEIINRAKSEWRQYGNVPRQKSRAIDKRFDQALHPILEKLKAEQTNNAEQKSALIQEVTELLEQDIATTDLVNRTKSAQQRWKSIGLTDRRQDQKLWKAFRQHCDAVFAKRDEGQLVAKSAAKESAEKFRSLCNTFSQLIDADHPLSRADITTFRKDCASSEGGGQGFQSEATKLIKKAEKHLKNQALADQEQMFRDFQRRCRLLDQFDAGKLDQAELDAQLEGDVSLDAKLSAAIAGRCERSNEDLTLIIIRLEILAELPSPESNQQARMGYQVQRLNKELSLGQKETRSEQEQARALLLEWFSSKEKAAELHPRFEKIAMKLGLPM